MNIIFFVYFKITVRFLKASIFCIITKTFVLEYNAFLFFFLILAFQTFFAKVNDTTFFKSPFDYNSVTFFYPFAYAKDSTRPTMQAKYEGEVFPWSVSLSDFDIENVRAGYGCGRGMLYYLFIVLSVCVLFGFFF